MHLNDESPMGKDAAAASDVGAAGDAAGDAAMAGPTSNTEMATQTLRMPHAADRIVIMINPFGFYHNHNE
jgi:hypothetical protein